MQWYPALKAIRVAKGEEEKKVVIGQIEEGVALLEEAYNNISKGKPFFGGDHIGYLDIAFGSFLGWTRVTETIFGVGLIDKVKTPGLAKWAEKFCADDAVKPVMPDTKKLVEFFYVLQAKFAASSK